MPAHRDLTASEAEWLRVRAHLRENRPRLSDLAAARYPETPRVAGTSLLTAPAWRPSEPVPLRSIARTWSAAERPGLLPPAELTEHVRPVRPDGRRHRSYADALADLAAPRVLQNRATYRLRAADLTGRPRLDFEPGRYFDALEVGEAVAHELAAWELGLIGSTPLRDSIGDPCDPARRPVNVAIAALTLRHDRRTGELGFPLHWRDPAKVGHAGGLHMVIPTGIFQATSDAPERQGVELSLWDCLVREYAEELLGEPELEAGDERLACAAWPFARAMSAGLDDGRIAADVCALGVDPLTFATDVLVVVDVESTLYDELFRDAVATNAEGSLARPDGGGDGPARFPLTPEVVAGLLAERPMQPAAAALLTLVVSRI